MSVNRTVTVDLDEIDIASEFCEMFGNRQARVLRLIASKFEEWGPAPRDRQLLEIANGLDTRTIGWLRQLVAFVEPSLPISETKEP